MTYRDQLLALADQSERRAVNAYSMFQRGWLSRGEIIAILAAIVATAKGQAASLAAMGLAAELMSRLQRPMPVTLLPVVDDLGRLRKAAATVLEVADQSDVPDAIVGRLAHSEPLETAANSYSEAMNRSPLVKGWVRQLSPNACELCRWCGARAASGPLSIRCPRIRAAPAHRNPFLPNASNPPCLRGGTAMPDDTIEQSTEENRTEIRTDSDHPADENLSENRQVFEAEESSSAQDDTFPRTYVEELREENKSWRLKAQRADDLAHRLHTELVKATGRLADPTDMPYDETHLDKPEKLAKAIDELLQRKPHLASRRPSGDVGQGATPQRANVDLAAILRNAR